MTAIFRRNAFFVLVALLVLCDCAEDGSRLGICGDAVPDPYEACEDGNTVNGDGCSACCKVEEEGVCNDGVMHPNEECEDGNIVDGDGCSAACKLEGEGVCGDGVKHPAEECDDGNTVDGDGCSADCESEAICGDGILDPFEECDDGNTDDGDGCSADCTDEPVCGDSEVESPETCDPPGSNAGQPNACRVDCTFCGDGILDPLEECDDGSNIDGDGCNADCTIEVALPATITDIQDTIFTPVCVTCHQPGGEGAILDLSDVQTSYANLSLPFAVYCSDRRVTPGDPDSSCLVHAIEGSEQFGGTNSRMPPSPTPALDPAQIDQIRRWIEEGAQGP